MPKVAAWKEPTWLQPKPELAMWRHLCRAYQVELELLDPSEPLPPVTGAVVILDEQGKTPLDDFTHPEDAVYVFGRTHQNNLLELPHNYSVVIRYPGSVCLFGICAAAIVLADREAKQ